VVLTSEIDGTVYLIDPGVREITIGSDAKFVNGVDFLLNRVPASDKPRIPP